MMSSLSGTTPPSPDIHTLTGAYAVDALPVDERRLFEAHLDVCEPCRQEVVELQATAARLGAAESLAPPPGLRDQVMAELDDVRQEPPRGRGVVVPVSRARRWSMGLLSSAAAIAAIAAIALSVVVLDLNDRLEGLEADTQVADVIAAPDAQVVEVATEGPETARVVLSTTRGEAVVLVDGMAGPPEGRQLVLWLIDGEGAAAPAGTLVLDEGGNARRLIAGDLAATAAIGVTVEPDDQPVREPTTDPVMVAELAT